MNTDDPNTDNQNDSFENAQIPKRNIVLTGGFYLLLVVFGLWLEWRFGVFSKLGALILSEINGFFAKPAHDSGYLPTPTR